MTNILVDIGNSALKWSSLENMEKPRAYLHGSKSQLSSALVSDLFKLPFEEAGLFGRSKASDKPV